MNRSTFRSLLPPLAWRGALPFVAIGALFWAVYLTIGLQIEAHGALQANDLFFNSDTYRILGDMCEFARPHKRTHVHPLFLFFVNPFGVALAHLTGSPFTAAVVLNSLIGAVAIALAGSFLWRVGISLRRSLLCSLILGFSSAHLFFGSCPETFAFSALSIILLFHALVRRPGSFPHFLAAGVFSFGILLTNLAFVAITFFASCLPGKSFWRAVGRTILLVVVVVTITAGLAWEQKRIWTSSRPFYVMKAYGEEERFMEKPKTALDVANREFLLLRHVFVFDWFAPSVEIYEVWKIRLKSDTLAAVPAAGKVGMVLWFGLLGAAAVGLVRQRFYRRPLPLALLLCLLFNFVLHTMYGDDLFLYACNTCFLVLTLIALGLEQWRLSPAKAWAVDGVFALVLVLQLANNHLFVDNLLRPRLAHVRDRAVTAQPATKAIEN